MKSHSVRSGIGKAAGVAIGVVVVLAVLVGIGSALGPTSNTGTGSIQSSSSKSTTSTKAANSTLYFVVTCVGCSVTNRSATVSCNTGVASSWFNKPWYQSEFGGELDYYEPQVGILGRAIFGNSTATYRFPPYGDLIFPPNYHAGYQGTPVNAFFQIISCQGTLDVKLMAANGSLIWQATAFQNALNRTVSYTFS